MLRLLLLGVAASWTLACATTPAARLLPAASERPLADEVGAVVAAGEAFAWSVFRPLSWEDFQAHAPSTGAEGALTSYNLLYGLRCTRSGFEYEVLAAFVPKESWVKPLVIADPALSAHTLRHEQAHFDLTEIHARRLRQFLSRADRPCGAESGAVREGAERLVSLEAEAQQQYDGETRHGLNASSQSAWERRVTEMLRDLTTFDRAQGYRPGQGLRARR